MQIEVKVKITNLDEVEEKIKSLGARFWKKTTETDTYFHSQKGVFKIKESSDGEVLLIHDYRPKDSTTTALRSELPLESMYAEKLLDIFKETSGIQLVLTKDRIQYILHGVLLAIDVIHDHETFLEVTSDEVSEDLVTKEKEKLLALLSQCGFSEKDVETKSYVDLYL